MSPGTVNRKNYSAGTHLAYGTGHAGTEQKTACVPFQRLKQTIRPDHKDLLLLCNLARCSSNKSHKVIGQNRRPLKRCLAPFLLFSLSVLFSLSPNQTGFKWCSGPRVLPLNHVLFTVQAEIRPAMGLFTE